MVAQQGFLLTMRNISQFDPQWSLTASQELSSCFLPTYFELYTWRPTIEKKCIPVNTDNNKNHIFQFKYTENSQIVLITRKNPAKHFLIITFSTEDQNCLISFEILAAIFFRRTDSSFSAFTSLLFCSWWYFKTALDIFKIKQLFQWYTLQ